MKLSIIIPVYNEEKTLRELLKRVVEARLPNNMEREIILVDDASVDETGEIISTLRSFFILVRHEINKGKGAAVVSGLKKAGGDLVIIQDADLEYDPNDYEKILIPLIEGEAEVVYGSRFRKPDNIKQMTFGQYIANRVLTTFSNFITGMSLTDMETGYKAFTREVVDNIKDKLISERFGIEPEITARVKKYRVKEVSVKYLGRSREEGKKIRWYDGLLSLGQIIKFNFWQ